MQQLKVSYDFLNNSLPADLMSLFTRSSDVHPNFDLNSSINNLLYIPRVKTTHLRYQIYQVPLCKIME